jgi:hypothetical protein
LISHSIFSESAGVEWQVAYQHIKRLFIQRCVTIEAELGSYATPRGQFRDVIRQCGTASGELLTFENLAHALKFDFSDLAKARKRDAFVFEESLKVFTRLEAYAMLNVSGVSLTPFKPLIFLPTAAHGMGAIAAVTGGNTVVLWEDGSYNASSVGPLPNAIMMIRCWLTLVLCPEKRHETLCSLLPRNDLCLCDLYKLNFPVVGSKLPEL